MRICSLSDTSSGQGKNLLKGLFIDILEIRPKAHGFI